MYLLEIPDELETMSTERENNNITQLRLVWTSKTNRKISYHKVVKRSPQFESAYKRCCSHEKAATIIDNPVCGTDAYPSVVQKTQQ